LAEITDVDQSGLLISHDLILAASTRSNPPPHAVLDSPISSQALVALKVSRSIGSDAAVQALLALKDRKGWTMEELAGQVGTTARTVQSLIKRRTVRSSVFRTMADRLGISPEDLLAGNVPADK
jgi:lambda repressor-like predicted transcriptional regulator